MVYENKRFVFIESRINNTTEVYVWDLEKGIQGIKLYHVQNISLNMLNVKNGVWTIGDVVVKYI